MIAESFGIICGALDRETLEIETIGFRWEYEKNWVYLAVET